MVLPLSRAGHHHDHDHRGHDDQQQNPDLGIHGPALLVSGFGSVSSLSSR
jgi:hypothetical protein